MISKIEEAEEVILRFDGKLRNWTTVGDDEHRCVRIDDFKEPTTQIEYEYIRDCRNLIEIIKSLLFSYQFEKQCKKVAENKLRRLICYNDIEKIENENKALKQRISKLEGGNE